jgi:hypothetical protein
MTKKISDPSNFIFSLDVPEVKNFNSKFVYNFFKKNESVSIVLPEDEEKGNFPTNIPRYVELSWVYVSKKPDDYILKILSDSGIEINSDTYINDRLFEKVVDENEINSFIPSLMRFTDNIKNTSTLLGNINVNYDLFSNNTFNYFFNEEIKKYNFFKNSLNPRIPVPPLIPPVVPGPALTPKPLIPKPLEKVQIDPEETIEEIISPTTDLSVKDVVKELGVKTDEFINDSVTNFLDIIKESGIGQIVPGVNFNLNLQDVQKNINNSLQNQNFSSISPSITTNAQNISQQSQTSLFSLNTGQSSGNSLIPQLSPSSPNAPTAVATNTNDFNLIEEDNIDIAGFIELIKSKILLSKHDVVIDNISNSFIVGFEIKKFENNQLVERLFLSENSNKINKLIGQTKKYFDTKILYGKTYSYSIRTISLVELRVKDESDSFSTIVFLVGSKFSPLTTINAQENEPPEPPQDFRQFWDSNQQKLIFSWSLANNKQRDVKKIQILRRNDIDSPFEIIKIYDFDDSIVKYTNNEFFNQYDIILRSELDLPDNLKTISLSNNTVLRHIIRNFDLNSKHIYTLRAVDAHGFSSDYSIQILIEYDKAEKNIKKTLISKTGAPKNFPNLFIKDGKSENPLDFKIVSKAKNMELLFDADMFNLFRANATQRLTVVGVNENFIMNIINVDNKQTKQLNINIQT